MKWEISRQEEFHLHKENEKRQRTPRWQNIEHSKEKQNKTQKTNKIINSTTGQTWNFGFVRVIHKILKSFVVL